MLRDLGWTQHDACLFNAASVSMVVGSVVPEGRFRDMRYNPLARISHVPGGAHLWNNSHRAPPRHAAYNTHVAFKDSAEGRGDCLCRRSNGSSGMPVHSHKDAAGTSAGVRGGAHRRARGVSLHTNNIYPAERARTAARRDETHTARHRLDPKAIARIGAQAVQAAQASVCVVCVVCVCVLRNVFAFVCSVGVA